MNRLNLAYCTLLAGVIALNSIVHAAPTALTDSVVVSPQVASDRTVTFRLSAPNAKQVRITGDFALNGVAMTKDAQGVWTYTTAALPPSIYGYSFNIDGVRFTDPGNLYISSGAAHLKSFVEVPGDKDKPEYWQIHDVPHGTVHENWYTSPTLGTRRIMVYTPPGYEASGTKTYPTIYLYHSATDNETYWVQVGRANFIMDNLLADAQAKPALVVSCFGHTHIPPDGDEGPSGGVLNGPAIENDILHSIIPLVESKYRVGKQNKDRAILGFSELGGYHALTIGLNNASTFGYIACLSSLFRANQDLDGTFQPLLKNIDASRSAFKLIKIQVGSQEGGTMTASSQTMDQYLTSKGLKHEYVVVPGGMHSWVSWRGYFRDFMTEIFKD